MDTYNWRRGWQRLWVALSAVYLFFVVAVNWLVFWPEDMPQTRDLVSIMHSYSWRWKEDRREKYEEECKSESRAEQLKRGDHIPPQQPGLLSVEELGTSECASRKLQKTVPSKAEWAQWEIQAKEQVRSAEDARRAAILRLVLFAFLFWVAPVVSAYLLGLLIGWVYRGFKGQPK